MYSFLGPTCDEFDLFRYYLESWWLKIAIGGFSVSVDFADSTSASSSLERFFLSPRYFIEGEIGSSRKTRAFVGRDFRGAGGHSRCRCGGGVALCAVFVCFGGVPTYGEPRRLFRGRFR